MSKSKNVRDQLALEKFEDISQVIENPLSIDISELENIKDSLPLDTQLDISIATGLASKYLRSADRCGEILASLTYWEQTAINEKKKAYSKAWLNARENGAKTDAMAKHKAETDEDYIEACKKEINVITAKEFFSKKHQIYIKSHFLMKDRVKTEHDHMKASGFPEGAGFLENGEKSWGD